MTWTSSWEHAQDPTQRTIVFTFERDHNVRARRVVLLASVSSSAISVKVFPQREIKRGDTSRASKVTGSAMRTPWQSQTHRDNHPVVACVEMGDSIKTTSKDHYYGRIWGKLCKCNIWNQGFGTPIASALSSAKRCPTRSECFKNLSAQLRTHCSSLEDSALLVKSLQHEVKHLSTRPEYKRKKSCICFFSMIFVM